VTALSCNAIRERLRARDDGKRLVISPLLDPAVQIREEQAAVDVRLSRSFSLVQPWAQGVAEKFDESGTARPPPMSQVVLDFGQPLIVHPHQFVLARTLEFVRLPMDLLAYVIGRSSWGRRGLIVATAVVVHPGFSGPITLELKNLGEVPVALYPFDRVAQLAFHQLDSEPGLQSAASQYAGTFAPSAGTVRDPETERRVKALAARHRAPGRRREP